MNPIMQIEGAVTPIASRRETTFAGDVLKLVSGTGIAHGLSILAAPVLTRLYAPDAFGTLALFTSITAVIAAIGCLRYELSIMLPEDDGEAANLLGLSLVFAILMALLSFPAIWFGGTTLLRALKADHLAPYMNMIPLSIFLLSVLIALNYWNSRTKQFGRLSIARVVHSFGTVSSQIGAGYAGYITGGSLICGGILGQAIGTGVLGGQIWRDDRKQFIEHIRLKSMLRGMKRYKKFPLVSTWAILMNAVAAQLPIFLLSTYFSQTVVGFYALGYRLLTIPAALIGAAVGQVVFQRASVAKREGQLAPLIETTLVRLTTLGILPFLLLSVTGRDVFVVVFGENWATAGVYAQILAPWTMVIFVGSPISSLYHVLERQGLQVLFNIAFILIYIFSLVAGGTRQNPILALGLLSAFGTLLNLCFYMYLAKIAGVHIYSFTTTILRNILMPIFLTSLVILLKILANPHPMIILIIACVILLFYFVLTNKRHLQILTSLS